MGPKNFLASQPTQKSELQVQRMTLLRNEVSMIKADIKCVSSNPLIYFNKWTSGINAEIGPQNALGEKSCRSSCNFKANSHSLCHPCCCPGGSCCVTQILTLASLLLGVCCAHGSQGEDVKCLPQSPSANRMSQSNPELTCCCLYTRVTGGRHTCHTSTWVWASEPRATRWCSEHFIHRASPATTATV